MYIPRQAPSLPPDIVASLSGVRPNTAPTAQPSSVQQDYGKNTTNGVAIALPVVLGVGIILAITYFCLKHKRPEWFARKPPLPTTAPTRSTAIAAPSTAVDRERRREIREQRRLAALRRTESGTSVSTLPVYNPTPADEEQILLKRLETDTLSLAPTYDDTPWPEHPPTWSEIHGSSGHGHRVMSPAQMSPTSPTSPSSFRFARGARSAPGSVAVHSQLSHAHSTHSAPARSPSKSPTKSSKSMSPEKYPARPSSAASSTWSVSTSSDEEEEVHTSRARRIIGESSAKLLGNSSLRRHLQRNASFRLSPANSRMSSIRSVFTARTHQPSHQHGESTLALLPTQETEEVLTDAASGVSSSAGRSPGGSRMSRNSSRSSLRESVLGVVGVLPRAEGKVERSESERRPEMGRSVSQGESMRKKLARKATA